MNRDQLARSPLHMLHRARQCAQDLFQVHMADINITPRQYAVLLAAAQCEGSSQRRIIDRTGIDRSTLSQIMQQMLKKGFLKRSRIKTDARTYAVSVTTAGWDVLNMSQPIVARVERELLAALPPGHSDDFLNNLTSVALAVAPDTP